VFIAQIVTKTPEISLKLAERLQKSGNCIKSLQVYQNPLNYSYTDDKRFSFLGNCYESRGQYNMAKAVYRHWTVIDPQSYDAWYSLGFAMEREYQINDAFNAYIKAYTLESQEYDVNLALGRTYLAKQMYKDAKTALIRATEINPQRYEAWLEISFAFLESDEDNAAPWSLGLVKERINQLTQEDRYSLDIAEALLICHQEPRYRCVQNARDVDVFHKPINNRSIALELILRAMNADRTGAVYVTVPASDDVAAFRIARTEVTNAQYAQCVTAGVCSEPVDPRAHQLAAYANHPVVYVSLEQAREYAAWVGGSLPTETQWLRA
jgi:tetratricopeptide (TPR) repeat protein